VKTLFVLRHGKSSWKNQYLADHDRPLKKRGKQDAPRMGRLLKDQDLVPDLIITSTAERALTTAELVALAADYTADIQVTRSFYHADGEEYIDFLAALDSAAGRIMVVGHNPGLEHLVNLLTGAWERMPTAALAQIELPLDSWANLSVATTGRLVNLWLPRELQD
jgi:phosphohistidine phosphatase